MLIQPIHTLITHTNPDFDAMMCVMLIRRFGEPFFPGVSEAKIEFHPAGKLPDGKTPQELEIEGILTVDIGGGRFDTHPNSQNKNEHKSDLSATDLVAVFLGLENEREWKDLVKFARLSDTKGHSLYSHDFLHHLISIPTLLSGIQIQYPGDSKQKLEDGIRLLENIPWYLLNQKTEFEPEPLLIEHIQAYLAENQIDEDSKEPEHQNILNWFRRLKENAQNTWPPARMDRMLTLRAMVIGSWFKNGESAAEIPGLIKTCLEAILAREKDWFEAIEDFDANAIITRINGVDVVAIQSKKGLVLKISRMKTQGDLIVYRHPGNGATTLMINRRGVLRDFDMAELAGTVRIAECVEMKEEPNFEGIEEVGDHSTWFFHQSFNLVIKGSQKALDFVPSIIPFDDLAELVRSKIDIEKHPAPEKYREQLHAWSVFKLKQRFGR